MDCKIVQRNNSTTANDNNNNSNINIISHRRRHRQRRRFKLKIISFIRDIFNTVVFFARSNGRQRIESETFVNTNNTNNNDNNNNNSETKYIYVVQNTMYKEEKYEYNVNNKFAFSLPSIDFDKLKSGASNGIVLTLTCIVFYQLLTSYFIYPAFRLLFGTLYPAYASYKAVRTKNVKEYVSHLNL